MTATPDLVRALADLLAYPGPGLSARAADCAAALAEDHPTAAARLSRFALLALSSGAGDLEEAYTRAFDLAPLCSPYVGDQLFGATGERSLLLAGLRELAIDAGVAPGGELPDHVSEMLRLVAAPIPTDVRDDLVRDGLAPALEKMLAALEEARHPWADVLAAVAEAVGSEAGALPSRPAEVLP